MARLIRVHCRKPGFRRAGLAHPARAEYPAEIFSAEQLAALRAEPMLSVQEVEEEFEGAGGGEAVATGAPAAPQPTTEPDGPSSASSPASGGEPHAPEQAAAGAAGAPTVSTAASGAGKRRSKGA